ncbi:ABC-2 family transporter protein [Aerococcaceae bacterium zg-1292]|uniref:ABC transporter permease n=2 Tax=Aerococcaceae bacterium zg-1292 TaxID=2774330 RepID=UPI0019B5618F|nr:ABC-2 family transporter protein [Aerococcaceae bacterium zg-1292]
MKGWGHKMTAKLFKTLINHSIQELLINRQTAIITFILGIIFYLLEVVAGIVFFDHTDSLLGWSRQDYLLLVTTASTISFLYQTLFAISHENLTEVIIEGELDHSIIRPVDSFWYYALYRVDFSSALNLLVTTGVLVYLLSDYTLSVTQIVLFVLAIILAAYFLFILNQLAVSVSFWKDNANSIFGLPEYLMEFSSRPLVVYPGAIRFIFTWCIPLLIGINLPVLIIRKEAYQLNLIYLMIVNLLGTILVRFVWMKGLKQYVSAN